VAIRSELWDLIKVENILQMTLKPFVHNKASDNASLYTTIEWCSWEKESNDSWHGKKFTQRKEDAQTILGWSCIMCSVSTESLSNQKFASWHSRRSMEWSQTKCYSSMSLWLCGICKDPICKNEQTRW
jgi:hypothetical protein